jgi:hypothetical protein
MFELVFASAVARAQGLGDCCDVCVIAPMFVWLQQTNNGRLVSLRLTAYDRSVNVQNADPSSDHLACACE